MKRDKPQDQRRPPFRAKMNPCTRLAPIGIQTHSSLSFLCYSFPPTFSIGSEEVVPRELRLGAHWALPTRFILGLMLSKIGTNNIILPFSFVFILNFIPP